LRFCSAFNTFQAKNILKEAIMYAIIETGSKQYRVKEGDIITVELLDKQPKDVVIFDKVLLYATDKEQKIGQPYLNDCIVEGEVIDNVKDRKVIAYKYIKRENYHRTKGHRQQQSKIRITKIKAA
jgi:large subunit ribosomal protein L21